MTLHAIIDQVAVSYGVSPLLLRSKSQEQHYTRPRHVACYVARKSGYTFLEVGRALGGRHHTTVMHSVRQVEKELATNPHLQTAIAKMLEGARRCEELKRDRMAWLPEDFAKEGAA